MTVTLPAKQHDKIISNLNNTVVNYKLRHQVAVLSLMLFDIQKLKHANTNDCLNAKLAFVK